MMLLIDVRNPEEYAAGHVDGAINLPVDHIVAGDFGVLANTERDVPLHLYCRSGARSEYARSFLESIGFENVINLGGMSDALKTN